MTAYLITYDLNRPGKDYPELYSAIKSLGAWWHYLDSTWLVATSDTAVEIRDRLKRVVDDTDRILVIKLTSSWASYNLPSRAADWIRERV